MVRVAKIRFAKNLRPKSHKNSRFWAGSDYSRHHSHSKELTYWGKRGFVMSPVKNREMTKVGAGSAPIETDEGRLVFLIGIIVVISGLVILISAYPVYKRITIKQRQKIASQIIALAEELEK